MFAHLRERFFELRLGWMLVLLWLKARARRALGIRRPFAHSIWTVRHLDAQGRLLWADCGHNMLHDEGEHFFCDVIFNETQSVPAAYYLGLDNRASLAEADTLASLSGEPSGNGYARQPVNSDDTDFTVSQESGDFQAKTKTVTFTASGGSIGPVTKMFLCTVVSGTEGVLIASRALSQERTLADTESLECSMYVKFSE